ncbi:MAG: hypothetical protein ACI8P0_006297, partial [Planctomycetaceae bacterium]
RAVLWFAASSAKALIRICGFDMDAASELRFNLL